MTYEEIDSLSISELENIIVSYIEMDVREYAMKRRSSLINKNFDFSEANVLEILRVNDLLFDKMNEVYNQVLNFKTKIDNLIANGDGDWNDYFLEGSICIQTNDDPLLESLSCNVSSLWWVNTRFEDQMKNRSECLMEDMNYDFELFNRPEIRCYNRKFCFLSHTLFVDNHILSLNEMVRLKEENIKCDIEILI